MLKKCVETGKTWATSGYIYIKFDGTCSNI